MKNTIVIYDFETVHSGKISPHTDQPIQLAGLAINSNTLEIKPGSEFNSMIRPESFAEISDDSISWHMKQRGWTKEQFIDTLTKAPTLASVTNSFVGYLAQYNYRKTKFTAPIRAGANIRKYDDIIWDRIRQQCGVKDDEGFHPRDSIDLLDVVFLWFESLPKPEKYNMDTLREYFGISSANAHDALKDCQDVANILIRFIKLHRKFAPQIKFEGSMRGA